MERIPDAEPIKKPIPETLIPKEDGPRFPSLTRDDLRFLAEAGWEKIGVISLLLNPDGQVLVVVHGADNPKVPEGMMGVLSETLTYNAKNVEQPEDGISRLLAEELGLTAEDIQALNLRTVEHGAWQNVTFPLGKGADGNIREALGLVSVFRMDQKSMDIINRVGSSGTPRGESILFGGFMSADSLAHGSMKERFRPGTQEIFVAGLDLLTTPRTETRLQLPPPKPLMPDFTEDLRELIR